MESRYKLFKQFTDSMTRKERDALQMETNHYIDARDASHNQQAVRAIKTLFREKNYAEALTRYGILLKANPQDALYWRVYADILEKIALSSPEHFARYTQDTYSEGTARPVSRGELLVNALGARRRVCGLQPNDARAWSQLVNSLIREGHYDEAYPASCKTRELSGDDRISMVQQAYVLNGLGRYDDALEVVDAVLQREPSYIDGHKLRAYVMLGKGEYPMAIREAEYMHTLDPAEPSHYLIAAEAFNGMSLPARALQMLQANTQPDEQNRTRRIRCQIKLGQFREALKALDEEKSDSFSHGFMRAQALHGTGQLAKAHALLDMLQEKSPNETSLYALRAQVLISQKDHASLKHMLTRQWPSHETEGNVLWHLYMGRTALAANDMPEALRHAHALYELPFHDSQMKYCRFVAALAGGEEQEQYKSHLHEAEQFFGHRLKHLAPLEHQDVLVHEAKWQIMTGEDEYAVPGIARSQIFNTPQLPASIDRVARRVSGIAVRSRGGSFEPDGVPPRR